ncbi:hypothetical protein [Aeromonas hydrophila]|nr:hypothetical protein [Aeromonas hydrophila]
MHQALAGYMERAAEKLREEGMCCRHVTLFIRTSPFSDKAPYYGNQVSTKLAMPTNDTRALLALIPQLLPASGVMSNVIRRAASCWPNSHRPTCGRATCSQWSSNHRAARR